MTTTKTSVRLNIGHTPNYATVNIGEYALHFSYHTLIGFYAPESGLVVRQNDWSTTTGKHLNSLNPNKSERLTAEAFEEAVNKYLPFRP